METEICQPVPSKNRIITNAMEAEHGYVHKPYLLCYLGIDEKEKKKNKFCN